MTSVANNSAAYGEFTVGTHSFILDVTNNASSGLAFADGVNTITITVTETNADNAEAWSVTFDSKTKYYQITISGLKTSGDAVWPNLYIKDATTVSYSGSQLAWNGFGWAALVT